MRTNKIFIIVGALAIGFLIGYLSVRISYFDFDKKINLIDLINVFATVFLGIYIAVYINKKNGQDSVEKQLLIKELESFQCLITSLYSDVISNNLPFNETVHKFKLLSMKHTYLSDTYNSCNKNSTSKLEEILEKLMSNKSLITGSRVNHGNLNVTGPHKSQVAKLTKEINKLIIDEIICVNRGV